MQVKVITIIIIALILSGCAAIAFADNPHHDNIPNVTVQNSVTNTSGVALGLACSALNFDARTYALQGSAGVGSYDNTSAVCFGLGKRLGKDGVLLNGSLAHEEGKTGASLGLSFKFK
jgi:uncharacterized protein YceK